MAVARQIHVHAEEDGVVAVQRDTIVDPELGIIAEVEKVVAAVDVGEGKVAVMEQNRVKAIRAIPTQAQSQPDAPPAGNPQPNPPPQQPPVTRSPYRPATNPPPRKPPVTRSPYRPSINLPQQYNVSDRAPLVETTQTHHSDKGIFPGFLFCGCVFLIAGALLVGLAVKLVLPCGRLGYASIPIIILGCLTIFVGVVCCVSTIKMEEWMAICCCICVALLLGPMILIDGYFGSSYIYGYYTVMTNGTHELNGDCDFNQAKDAPLGLIILSFVFLVLTCCFSIGTCINAGTRHDPLLYKKGRVSC